MPIRARVLRRGGHNRDAGSCVGVAGVEPGKDAPFPIQKPGRRRQVVVVLVRRAGREDGP